MPKADERTEPWYRQPSLIISMLAFFISVLTTATSAYRTYRQDVEARKTELRAVIQQINAGQLQAIEMFAKHQNDNLYINVATTLNTQNIMVAKQAYVLVKDIGRDASSMEYGIVSYALSISGQNDLAEELGLIALDRATNLTEYLGAARQLAIIKMTLRRIGEAEIYWKRALNAFDRFPRDVVNEQYAHYQNAFTHLSWAQVSTDCKMLFEHLDAADKEIKSLGQPPMDLVQYRNQFANACPQGATANAAVPVPPPPPPPSPPAVSAQK